MQLELNFQFQYLPHVWKNFWKYYLSVNFVNKRSLSKCFTRYLQRFSSTYAMFCPHKESICGSMAPSSGSMAPFSHWEFEMSMLNLNVKRAPMMSMLFDGLPLHIISVQNFWKRILVWINTENHKYMSNDKKVSKH